MRIPRRLWFATALSALATTCPAQQVAGSLLGFDGKPTAGGIVVVYNRFDNRVAEVVTGADGRFEFDGDQRIESLVMRFEAITLEQRMAAAGQRDVVFRLDRVPHWTINGHVVDPDGRPAAGIDVVAHDDDGKAIGVVTTNAKGAYSLRSNQRIPALCTDPLGWRHITEGPFANDRGVAIDLRLVRDDYVRRAGRVLDADGQPVAGAIVKALDTSMRQAVQVGSARTAPDGTFAIWTNRHLTQFKASFDTVRMEKRYDDRTNRPITLRAQTDALVLVVGRVVDGEGAPIDRALVYTSGDATVPTGTRAVGRTNRDGMFQVTIPRGTPFLVAGDRKKPFAAKGPWPGQAVTLRPAKTR